MDRHLEVTNSDLAQLARHLGKRVHRNALSLPKQGAVATAPWPGHYWPIYLDSINFQWNKPKLNPTAKYAKAFGLNRTQLEDAVSLQNGILGYADDQRKCTTIGDCAKFKDGSECGRRAGQVAGYCIPRWFGICHAWAPASFAEPEPQCAVKYKGVVFQPNDLKALVTHVYDQSDLATGFLGARFRGPDDMTAASLDQFGRFKDDARRDLNPGLFHLALANLVGRFGKSFVMDVDANAPVWNHPVRSYAVLEFRELLRPFVAGAKWFWTLGYPFNRVAAKVVYVKNRVAYVLEGGDNRPYVNSGRVDQLTKVVDYGESEQECPKRDGQSASHDGQDRECAGDVGGHGNAPATGQALWGEHVDPGEDQRGNCHAADGCSDGHSGLVHIGQRAQYQFVLELQADDEEEHGEQSVG